MKCSTIQRENINRGHAANIIATNVQNGIPFNGHKPWDVSIRQSPHRQHTVCCTPDQTGLRRCCSWSFKSFKTHSKWFLSILLLQILSWIC